jgi:hypothetical protein
LEGAARPMQSSTAIAIRALVMLIVLISVPLFAIFGKNLPEVIKGVLDGRGLVLGPAPAAQNPPGSGLPAANNPFAQPTPYRAATDSTAINQSPAGSEIATDARPNHVLVNPAGQDAMKREIAGRGANRGAIPGNTETAPLDPRSPGATNPTQPASFQAPFEAAPMGQDAVAPREPNFNRAIPDQPQFGNAGGSPPPQGRDIAARSEAAPATRNAGAAAAPPSAAAIASDEKFRRAEQRLRELGATKYSLQTWGRDDNQYLFVCRMAVGGNPNMSQVFQAIKDEPLAAMDDVLSQVEQWRTQPAH